MAGNAALLPAPVTAVMNYYLKRIGEENITAIASFSIIGSAAMADFHYGKSDIDFMASLSRKFTEDEVVKLGRIHKEIKEKFIPDLNGFYIEERLYQNPLQEDIECYVCFNARVYKGTRPAMYTMPYFQLKTASVTVYGMKPEVHFDQEQLFNQLHDNLNDNWGTWIKQHRFPHKRSFALMLYPHLTEWSVLNVGRYLYILQTGKIVSKKETGIYLLKHFPDRYHDIIRESLDLLPINKKKMAFSIRRYRNTIKILDTLLCSYNQEFEHRAKKREV